MAVKGYPWVGEWTDARKEEFVAWLEHNGMSRERALEALDLVADKCNEGTIELAADDFVGRDIDVLEG